MYINIIKKKFFNEKTLTKIFNFKQKIFVKNRKTMVDNIFVKYSKSRNRYINIYIKRYLKKNIFKLKCFWLDIKKPDIRDAQILIKRLKFLEKYE